MKGKIFKGCRKGYRTLRQIYTQYIYPMIIDTTTIHINIGGQRGIRFQIPDIWWIYFMNPKLFYFLYLTSHIKVEQFRRYKYTVLRAGPPIYANNG